MADTSTWRREKTGETLFEDQLRGRGGRDLRLPFAPTRTTSACEGYVNEIYTSAVRPFVVAHAPHVAAIPCGFISHIFNH